VATRMIGGGRMQTYGRGPNADNCRPPLATGHDGRVRVEAFDYSAGYFFDSTEMTRGVPFGTYLPPVPSKPAFLWVSEINNQQLPRNPIGGLGVINDVNQYVTLQDALAPEEEVQIVVSGEHLPIPGDKDLIPILHVFPLEGKDIVKPCDAKMEESEGDPNVLSCTVTIAGTPAGPGFPPGFSRAYARLSWN
jgi:hypothetical protein